MLKYLFVGAALLLTAQLANADCPCQNQDIQNQDMMSNGGVEIVQPEATCQSCMVRCVKGADSVSAIKACGEVVCNAECKTN